MRGVDLNAFQFDYDLTWMAFFMNADGKIYGRFGGREGSDADQYLTLPGLKYAMQRALKAHREKGVFALSLPPEPIRFVEQYPAARRFKADACIHCHQVYEMRRENLRAEGKWNRDRIWVYPPPSRIGLTLDRDQQDRIVAVAPGSPAGRLGLLAGDRLQSFDFLDERPSGQGPISPRVPVASYADVTHALQRAPAEGNLTVTWVRNGASVTGELVLRKGWKESDISWRESMWGLEPTPSVYGMDLTPEQKRAMGLSERQLAFVMGNFVPVPARKAGLQAKDIVLGFEGRPWEMTMLQFNAYVRLNYRVGDAVVYEVIRDGRRLRLPATLAGRDSS